MVFALLSWGGGLGVAVLAFLFEYGVCGGLTPAVSRRATSDVLEPQTTIGAVGSSALLGAPLLPAGAVGSCVVSQRGATAGLVSWPCPLSWNAFCLGMLFVLECLLSWNAFRLGNAFCL